MASFHEYMNEYRKQLEKGVISKGIQRIDGIHHGFKNTSSKQVS